MGLMDKLKKVATDHGDKIEKGIDQAAKAAEKRAGAKNASKVRQVADKAKDAVDNLADDKKKPRPDEPPSRMTP
jgi:hypothetical protein